MDGLIQDADAGTAAANGEWASVSLPGQLGSPAPHVAHAAHAPDGAPPTASGAPAASGDDGAVRVGGGGADGKAVRLDTMPAAADADADAVAAPDAARGTGASTQSSTTTTVTTVTTDAPSSPSAMSTATPGAVSASILSPGGSGLPDTTTHAENAFNAAATTADFVPITGKAKAQRLKSMDVFVLDNSLRETTVANPRGLTVAEKVKILDEVDACGIKFKSASVCCACRWRGGRHAWRDPTLMVRCHRPIGTILRTLSPLLSCLS